ncbi:MAG: ATP-dependent helicase, partial [Candidatus Kapaibacterium sp.]
MNKVCTHIGFYGLNDFHGIIIEEQSGFSMKLSLIKQTDSTQSTIQGLLGQLNPTQRQAAETTDGPVLIIAGAGSGKTRVLTFRVAHLIQKGVLPQSILALTFTNKAASEMKARISALVDPLLAKKVWAGTFHSIFARILRIEAELIGYDSTFSIYDADDSLSIIRACMNYAGVSTQQITAQSIRGKISHAKNQMIGWQQFSADAASINDRLAAKVYQEYEKRLKANNAMDFDDILLSMIHVLRLFPDVRDKYNDRFRYVMVDEYQDTNRAQYTAIRLLTEKHSNICVVGDDAQSIYRWRGADIRNILEFQKDYPEVKTIRLEQNYRSTKTILDAANGVIKNNRKQLKKTIWTDNNEGELITVMPAETERDEAEMIVNSIQSEIRRNDYEYKDFAVLYRTNAQSQPLEESFRRNALPYTIIGGMSFYKRKEVKDTMAYLRLLINTRDAESVERVLNVPPRGIGDTSLKKIEEYAAMQSISLYEALTENNAIPSLQPRTKKSVNGFIALIEKYRELLGELPLVDVIQTYIEATGITRMYSDEGTEEAQDRVRNIEQILATVAEYAEEEEEPTLEGFLQQFSLMTDADDTDLSKDSIALMTLHAAKGLE